MQNCFLVGLSEGDCGEGSKVIQFTDLRFSTGAGDKPVEAVVIKHCDRVVEAASPEL